MQEKMPKKEDKGVNLKEVAQLFSEAGFLASRYLMADEADELHEIIELAYPGTEAPIIGKAYNLICKKATGEAITLLEKTIVTKGDKASDLLRGFLGLAFFESGEMASAEKVLSKVVQTKDPVAQAMAQDLMKMIKKQG